MTAGTSALHPARAPAGETGTRRLFVRDLVLSSRLGVYHHERDREQKVRINLDLAVLDEIIPDDRLANAIDYEKIVQGVKRIVGERHVNLVETLAERIAAFCLADRRVRSVRVGVEKLWVFADAASVGVEIERFHPDG